MAKHIVARIFIAASCLLGLGWGLPSLAQKSAVKVVATPAKLGDAALLRSDLAQLQSVDMARLKGKVVMAYYWSTKCSVCLEKMHELRSNVTGWKGKPFVIVAINRDEKRQDFEDYLAIAKQLNVPSAQLMFIHAQDLAVDNLSRAGHLPLSFIMDTGGILQHMHSGRIPPEVWDQVSDLMP